MTRVLLIVTGAMAVVRLAMVEPVGVGSWLDSMPPSVPAAARPSPATPRVDDAPQVSPTDPSPGDEGGTVDIEGDEVTPALAKYAIDPHGNLYEVHAPNTEVPQLRSPKA